MMIKEVEGCLWASTTDNNGDAIKIWGSESNGERENKLLVDFTYTSKYFFVYMIIKRLVNTFRSFLTQKKDLKGYLLAAIS